MVSFTQDFYINRFGGGYTKINTGFSGSNIPGENPKVKERRVKQGQETGG